MVATRTNRQEARTVSEQVNAVCLSTSSCLSRASSVGIVGAGFTGTLLAAHLLQKARTRLTIHLFEQHGWFGRGVAYSTVNPSHLLNVRVANMSAFPDDPAHFLLWLWRFDYHVDGLPITPQRARLRTARCVRQLSRRYVDRRPQGSGTQGRVRDEGPETVGIRRFADHYVLSFRGAE